MKRIVISGIFFLCLACSLKDKYDVSRYYNAPDQEAILTGIVTHIFDAPPLTLMKDRFDLKHHNYYAFISSRFSIEKYFIADDGTHYFYVIRPSPEKGQNRGVGGHFRVGQNFQLIGFREVFVTPILPEQDVKGRCAFLFDEMVKGNIDQYLSMQSYVQWPNPISYYDTITYEWKLKPEMKNSVE